MLADTAMHLRWVLAGATRIGAISVDMMTQSHSKRKTMVLCLTGKVTRLPITSI